ncbi:MAG: ATP-dependent DNA helicase [Calditrichaeota bacterium]|nr:ATP-dependent DNA helicase [Calditrichota bacterium]
MTTEFNASVGEVVSAITPLSNFSTRQVPRREHLGQRAHLDFISRQSNDTKSEVGIKGVYSSPEHRQLSLHGRIDLLETLSQEPQEAFRITEFKSVVLPIASLDDICFPPPERFTRQALIYTYLVSKQKRANSTKIVNCRLVIHNLTDDAEKTLDLDFDVREIEGWLNEYIDLKIHEKAKNTALSAHRCELASTLTMPYPTYRNGQKDTIDLTYESFCSGKDVIWEASPGFGKTITMLLPALKAALGRGKPVFFATAKGGGRQPVLSTIEAIQKYCPELSVIFLSARSELCLHKYGSCRENECSFEKLEPDEFGRFDTPSELDNCKIITRRELRDVGELENLCPVDLSFLYAERSDIVIGDYNFVYDPGARLRQFRDPGPSGWTLLVDEAHNLFNRGREIFSTAIPADDIWNCRRMLEDEGWRFDSLGSFQKLLIVLELIGVGVQASISEVSPAEPQSIEIDETEWEEYLDRLSLSMADFIIDAQDRVASEVVDSLWSVYRQIEYFVHLLDEEREAFPIYADVDVREMGVKCLDASGKLADINARFNNIAAFSGTMSPLEFYKTAIGLTVRPTETLQVDPIFSRTRQLVVLADDIDTRFKMRPREAKHIAETLIEFCGMKTGGYLAVFPSFAFMNLITPYLDQSDLNFVVQARGMSYSERRRMRYILDKPNETTLAMIVAGGQFSEAADYPGDACVGVAIVGPCLPPPDPWRDELGDYWQRNGEDGEKVAYIVPAMQRVVQAAGRLIRSEEDRGVVLLMDNRYLQSRFLDVLPVSWQDYLKSKKINWQTSVRNFWAKEL